MIKKIKPDLLFILVILVTAGILNCQLLDNSNINFALAGHDEYLTVREVYSILNPLSIKHFFMAIISGDVLYYGRIMFYTDAIFAWLPFKLFGITGMVYSIRMLHSLMVIAAILILSRTFLKDWKYRLIFYLATLTLYYSAYFFMVPKPEPMQLLILALFFYFFKTNQYQFGKFFLLLGIAYGIKFNILTLLPIIFIIPFLFQSDIKKPLNKLGFSIFYFFIGLIIAVPCLLLSPVKPIFLRSYINATFANTSNYDDDKTVGMIDWLGDGFFGAYNGGWIFGVLLVILILVILFYSSKVWLRDQPIPADLLFIICGLLLILPVIIFTGRLWPHYLWTGYIFLMLGIVIFVQSERGPKAMRTFGFSAMIILIGGSVYCSINQEKKLISFEANTRKLNMNGQRAYAYLKNKYKIFIAIQELSVPYPFNNMLEVGRYNPFTSFNQPKVAQQFIWTGFINPQIINDNKADFIIINSLNFSDTTINLQTNKDEITIANNRLMNEILGRKLNIDTIFGSIKIYKLEK
ncbi:MAG: hypothetical protein PSX81_13500 [bacterium]|nr:hypothetical protein [bacterium]